MLHSIHVSRKFSPTSNPWMMPCFCLCSAAILVRRRKAKSWGSFDTSSSKSSNPDTGCIIGLGVSPGEGGREGGREGERKGGREEGRKGGREEGRKGGREEGRKGGREEGREGGKRGGREGGEGGKERRRKMKLQTS